MRITVDIDANQLLIIQKMTGQKKKSPALCQALMEFVREREKQAFLEKVLGGGADYSLTNEQVEGLDIYEAH